MNWTVVPARHLSFESKQPHWASDASLNEVIFCPQIGLAFKLKLVAMRRQVGAAAFSIRTIACLAAIAVGCNRTDKQPSAPTPGGAPGTSSNTKNLGKITSTPLQEGAPTDSAESRFERLDPEEIGIDFVNAWIPPDKYKVMLARSFSGAGVTVGDVDGDGLTDVYLPRPFGGGRLYRNLGDFNFEDATKSAGLAGDTAWGAGASFVDIDNDGDLDLYVCGFDCPNRLHINNGQGRFTERAAEYGLDFVGASVMMSFADYDRDGDLDGFLATNRHAIEGHQVGSIREANRVARRVRVVAGRAVFPDDLVEKYSLIVRGQGQATIIKAGQFGRLFRNNGDGTFEEVARKSGIVDNGLTLAATWWDYNHDGWPDLYVANDFYGPDRLYHNNGDGTFRDVGGDALPHTPWFSMGVDLGDINNDGRIDFIAADMAGTTHYKRKVGMGDTESNGWFLEMGRPRQYMRNAVYLNVGSKRMMEVAHLLDMANSDWTWSPKFGDLDNDGDLDLFISNGMSGDWSNSDLMREMGDRPIDEVIATMPPKRDTNLAFENLGDLRFQDTSQTWQVGTSSCSYGAALADFDNDGDLDILTNDFDAPPQVYRNRTTGAHRIKISLHGVESNRLGVGAFVAAEAGDRRQVRSLTLARGFMSTNEPTLHFGLGDADQVDRLAIEWPSGRKQEFSDLEVDRHYVVTEPSGGASNDLHDVRPSVPEPLFNEIEHDVSAQQEEPFDDFARQPLLPHRLSQLGPAIAVGDVDGDDDDDLFFAGPAGAPGRIYRNQAGRFTKGNSAVFLAAKAAEDMGALFVDVDADDDLDLYVVSGGVECEIGESQLRDRLYLNDGNGNFALAPEGAIPDLRESGSCVVAADFDRDGDLDLFVGGRVVPGQYPRTPNSALLINKSANGEVLFEKAADSLAPGLQKTGMVTSALWSDVDNDGWIDLLVAHEWGPIRVFRNESGELRNATEAAGLAKWTGWWNGLSGGDIDNDGDIDYFATNLGLNTRYVASQSHPAIIFYHDFDAPGEYRLVEAYVDKTDQLRPMRGRFYSSKAMPFIGKKCESFHDFAMSTLPGLYGDRGLDDALRLEANELQSMLLRNDGKGGLSLEPLGRLAQASPGFGVTVLDVDADGNLDAVIAQNSFSPQSETGRMDGGLGLAMLGDGKGGFHEMSPLTAGVVIADDAKSALVADVDLDGVPDVIVGVNDGPPHILRGSRSQPEDYVRVELRGGPGNPTAIGASATAHYEDSSTQKIEVCAGGSYLSQGTSTIWFGAEQKKIVSVSVRWPNGETSEYLNSPEQKSIRLRQDGTETVASRDPDSTR